MCHSLVFPKMKFFALILTTAFLLGIEATFHRNFNTNAAKRDADTDWIEYVCTKQIPVQVQDQVTTIYDELKKQGHIRNADDEDPKQLLDKLKTDVCKKMLGGATQRRFFYKF
ncbi:hypothetical protein L596_012228 [Steinernema carpocapsae]|uniref:Uncharacterized protein n=1 Tax=Steinernema carpocapsae TaxID=34508 RepID=A0A4U5NWF1_STECR|nr:hypothetical protein L596_012228 [Steinernema carpocapsae]